MSGTQFVKALRHDNELRRSIVFILTTSKREEDKMTGYHLNVAAYIALSNGGRRFPKFGQSAGLLLVHCGNPVRRRGPGM